MSHLDSEIILIESLQKGELTALPQLMQLYQKSAIQWASQIVRDTYLAEDAVQEAFAQLQRKIPSLIASFPSSNQRMQFQECPKPTYKS